MRPMTAWLLDLGAGRVAAVAEREMLHLVPDPQCFELPQTPVHCRRVLRWQDRILPVWDVAAWLGAEPWPAAARVVAVVGYQKRRREAPRYGALLLAAPPVRVKVTDDDACELLQDGAGWEALAVSCFRYREQPIPVLNLRRLFYPECN